MSTSIGFAASAPFASPPGPPTASLANGRRVRSTASVPGGIQGFEDETGRGTGREIICRPFTFEEGQSGGDQKLGGDSDLDAAIGLNVRGDEPAPALGSDARHGGDARDPAFPAGIVLP